MKTPRSGMRRIAAVVFAILFFAIPLALLASLRPWVLAVACVAIGLCCLILGHSGLPRTSGVRNLAKGFLSAAVILAILHFSGILGPFYERYGWLLLDMETRVTPLEVAPGGTLTYALATTHPGPRAARQRSFHVDGTTYKGIVLYGLLPTLNGEGFPLVGSPIAAIKSPSDDAVLTLIYADLQLPELNPGTWGWSTTYTPGWEAVGVITSDGTTNRDFYPGESISLQYTVRVPDDHPERDVRNARGSLSYRDPSWATYYVQELRFPFEETVQVVREE